MARRVLLSWVSLVVSAAASMTGCSDHSPAPAGINLTQPAVVTARTPSAISHIDVVAAGNLAKTPSPLTLAFTGLELEVKTGAHPQLETLALPIGDVTISAETLPPNGLRLRDVTLGIAGPVRAEVLHAQPDAVELSVRAPLRLQWSMELADGSLYPLGPAPTTPLDLDVKIVGGIGGQPPVATLSTRCQGICWSLKGIAELRDGALYLEAGVDVTQ
jgi:hypothetical protein